jgi:hypothetical protein
MQKLLHTTATLAIACRSFPRLECRSGSYTFFFLARSCRRCKHKNQKQHRSQFQYDPLLKQQVIAAPPFKPTKRTSPPVPIPAHARRIKPSRNRATRFVHTAIGIPPPPKTEYLSIWIRWSPRGHRQKRRRRPKQKRKRHPVGSSANSPSSPHRTRNGIVDPTDTPRQRQRPAAFTCVPRGTSSSARVPRSTQNTKPITTINSTATVRLRQAPTRRFATAKLIAGFCADTRASMASQ